ncbi:MAG: extracellular solute-binding protein [Rhodoferax sp.]|nr:extracellular solute-binding protein [Rhodoferax sp.]
MHWTAGLTRRSLLASGVALAAPALTTAAARMTITVAAFPLVDEIAKAALPIWRQLHPDVEVRVVSRQYADHHTAMTTALSTSVLLPDAMALESSFVGRFAQGGGLEDLRQTPYSIASYRDKLVPFAYDQATARNGAIVAIPGDIGPGAMLWRKDVLERAGVSESELTQSWDSYIAAGARIKARTGAHLIGHVRSMKDLLQRTGMKPGEGTYFDAESRVLVTSDRFVRTFELCLEARRLKLDAKVPAWSNEWAEGLKRGTLATELSGAWLVGQLSNWIAPQTAGLWRAAQLPEGVATSYGGAYYAMPRRAPPERKAMAWEFIRLMSLNRERQLFAFKNYDAFPALLETHSDAFFDEPVPFLGGQKARRLWRDAALSIKAAYLHKQNFFADEVISTELDNVLDRGKSIRIALGDAQRLLERRAFR